MRDDILTKDSDGDLTARAREFVIDSFRGAHVVEQDGVSCKMWIPMDASTRSSVVERKIKSTTNGVRLSSIFRAMENSRKDLGIAEYGISQPTLEQVFLEISSTHKKARDEEEEMLTTDDVV